MNFDTLQKRVRRAENVAQALVLYVKCCLLSWAPCTAYR